MPLPTVLGDNECLPSWTFLLADNPLILRCLADHLYGFFARHPRGPQGLLQLLALVFHLLAERLLVQCDLVHLLGLG